MAVDIKVPAVGESITEVTLIKWIKKDGDWVERDEVIAELESEKATFEINAEQAGILKTVAAEGDTLKIGDIACSIDTAAAKPGGDSAAPATTKKAEQAEAKPVESASKKSQETAPKSPEKARQEAPSDQLKATPVAAAIIADKKVDPKSVTPTGSNGRIFKQDVLQAINNPGRKPGLEMFSRNENAQKMSNLRKTISRRLVEAKNTTAMLTTFNEVDMSRHYGCPGKKQRQVQGGPWRKSWVYELFHQGLLLCFAGVARVERDDRRREHCLP